MKKLSSEDRSALIRLAKSLPESSEERKAILAGLAKTKQARKKLKFRGGPLAIATQALADFIVKGDKGAMKRFERVADGLIDGLEDLSDEEKEDYRVDLANAMKKELLGLKA